jgi:serine/threonine-protein kinase HipA
MHAKNISLLHPHDAEARLAPMYDVVPHTHHEGVDGELALAVNGVYTHRDLTAGDLVAEGQNWGIRDARRIVEDVLEQVRVFARSEAPHPGAHPELQDDIVRFASNLLDGRAAGESFQRNRGTGHDEKR